MGQGLGQDESQRGTWKATEGNCRKKGVGAVMVFSTKGYLSTKTHLKLASNNWRPTLNQIANIRWIIKKAREFQKTSTSALLTVPKPYDSGSQQTMENSSREGVPDHLTCLLRNLYAGQEATVRTGHGTTDWLQIGE